MEPENETRLVLIALDGSEHADYAFEWYMRNVHQVNNKLLLIHCPEFHTIIYTPHGDKTAYLDKMKEKDEKVRIVLERLGERLKRWGVGGTVRSVYGNPPDEICKAAKEDNVGLIVIGCRGLGVIRRTLMGSVSDYIIRHAHVPVLVARHKDHHKQ